MGEREKMIRGELYDATDSHLVLERRRARSLTKSLNESRDEDTDARARILADLFGKLGEQVWIEPPFYCDYGFNIALGSRVFFNFECVILDPAPVEIGNDVLFGPGVHVYTATHPIDYRERRAGLELAKPVWIGSDTWIGGGAIIGPGVRIGDRSIVGAGSVVTKDIPPGVLAAGNPCRVIRALEEGDRP